MESAEATRAGSGSGEGLASGVVAPEAYRTFLESKRVAARTVGFDGTDLNTNLFAFQADIVRWALRLGRAAIFAGCGLGKTLMQLEWALQVVRHTGKPVLILTPLAVGRQTVAEAGKFGIKPVVLAEKQSDVTPMCIAVTNYQKLHHFDPTAFAGVVLDESAILKAYMGKTKQALIEAFAATPYKLCCTATPAPNDHLELGNHAQFLGVMDSNEMISRWFINDTMHAGSYRLKGHAAADFWRWVSSWAICLEKPSDLGYPDDGFALPPLEIEEVVVPVDPSLEREGALFRMDRLTATTMHKEMRLTAPARASKVAELVATVRADAPAEPFVVWVNTNYEEDALTKVLPNIATVRGSDKDDKKERTLDAFSAGVVNTFGSKPSICGHGLNWQHCCHAAFMGLSYSFEQLYQAIYRLYRFGQKRRVKIYLVIAESEGEVLKAVKVKWAEFAEMRTAMVKAMRENSMVSNAPKELRMDYKSDMATGANYALHLGDCVDVAKTLPDESVDFTIFSPPFSNLYIYSDSYRDMGNSADGDEFFTHFKFLIPELLRITVPGRLCAVHCKDLPLYRGRDGAGGLNDFPGDLRFAMSQAGWVFHSRVTIWKDPVIEMQRTKNQGLLYKQCKADSSYCRQGMADYLLVFRKWNEAAEFPKPVCRPDSAERFPAGHAYVGLQAPVDAEDERQRSIQVWQRYASPVWMDIDQTDVLNYQLGRDGQDEKHICPLQLGVIRRAVDLWTNRGDTVFSPFAGIGSEGYVSLSMQRKFVGAELKDSYWQIAQKNLALAEEEARQKTLFDVAEEERRTAG